MAGRGEHPVGPARGQVGALAAILGNPTIGHRYLALRGHKQETSILAIVQETPGGRRMSLITLTPSAHFQPY